MTSRRTFLAGTAALSLAALAGCTTTEVLGPPGSGSDETEAVLGLVNQLRRSRGLGPCPVTRQRPRRRSRRPIAWPRPARWRI